MKNASAKEEKKEAIKQAGMHLSDDELDQVSGGQFGTMLTPFSCSINPACPYAGNIDKCRAYCGM